MRVLFVGPFPWPSHQGSQAYLAGQATALARRGHEVHVVVYGAGSGGDLPGVTLHRARPVPGGDFTGGGLHPSRPLHDLALARAVRRISRAVGPQVLHAHNVEGPLAAWLARTAVPIVYDLHTRMEEELSDHLPPMLRPLGPHAGRTLDRLAMGASSAGCAISERAEAAFLRAGLPVVRVGPGIEPSELEARPGTVERFGDPPYVVYTGNLDRYQNLELLVESMRGSSARLLVVTGSEAPLAPHVQVVRSRDFRDAIDALSVATLAVIPREACAGFPIKLLNQLGMGVPTVMLESAAIDLPGVVSTTPRALGETIETLLKQPARIRELGQSARSEVLENWTWDARMERLESLYESVIREWRP